MNDEVVRGSIIMDKGKILWPPPAPTVAQTTPPVVRADTAVAITPPSPFAVTLRNAGTYTGGKDY